MAFRLGNTCLRASFRRISSATSKEVALALSTAVPPLRHVSNPSHLQFSSSDASMSRQFPPSFEAKRGEIIRVSFRPPTRNAAEGHGESSCHYRGLRRELR